MMSAPLQPGIIDVHAHWLPQSLFGLPPGAPYGPMQDRGGELFLGEMPLSISTSAMSDVAAIRADMVQAGLGVRVLSAPPFAFAVNEIAADYVGSFNDSLASVVSANSGVLLGLGMVSLTDPDVAGQQLRDLAGVEGIAGVALPPVVSGESFDRGNLRAILGAAAELDLAVLVHPMQLPRPEWSANYLANLIGNPVETATAVATAILGGTLAELPGLRICFVHGGGCAPALLGRWEHGWESRGDVRAGSDRRPRDTFADLYFDTVTHDDAMLSLLKTHAGDGKVLCGSDYPFDMAQADPAGFATRNGLSESVLTAGARKFLGL